MLELSSRMWQNKIFLISKIKYTSLQNVCKNVHYRVSILTTSGLGGDVLVVLLFLMLYKICDLYVLIFVDSRINSGPYSL